MVHRNGGIAAAMRAASREEVAARTSIPVINIPAKELQILLEFQGRVKSRDPGGLWKTGFRNIYERPTIRIPTPIVIDVHRMFSIRGFPV
jgi:hypothetical protein